MKILNIRPVKIVLFLLFIFALDQFVGEILENLYQNSSFATISKVRHTYYNTNEDILIFGPSSAQHHYIPDTISKGTNYSAYNCGLGGQPIAYSLVQISETLKRYEPKIIILDIPPDISLDKDYDPRLKVLNPFYHDNIMVRRILINNGPKFEKLKYLSSIYPYNGMLADMLLALVYHPNITTKGFTPIHGSKIDPNAVPDEKTGFHGEIPTKQMNYLREIVQLCQKHNVDLWIMISPIYKMKRYQSETIQILRIFSDQNDINFLDFSKNSNFSSYLLFRDNYHLNIDGAIKYSGMIRDTLFYSKR